MVPRVWPAGVSLPPIPFCPEEWPHWQPRLRVAEVGGGSTGLRGCGSRALWHPPSPAGHLFSLLPPPSLGLGLGAPVLASCLLPNPLALPRPRLGPRAGGPACSKDALNGMPGDSRCLLSASQPQASQCPLPVAGPRLRVGLTLTCLPPPQHPAQIPCAIQASEPPPCPPPRTGSCLQTQVPQPDTLPPHTPPPAAARAGPPAPQPPGP